MIKHILFFGVVFLFLSIKTNAQQAPKIEGIAEIVKPVGNFLKTYNREGIGIVAKGVSTLNDKVCVTASIGFYYFMINKNSSNSSNGLTTQIPLLVGVRYYLTKCLFVEPQVGYCIAYQDISGTTEELGGGIDVKPTLGFKVGNGFAVHTFYQYCNVKKIISNDISSFGIGMAIKL